MPGPKNEIIQEITNSPANQGVFRAVGSNPDERKTQENTLQKQAAALVGDNIIEQAATVADTLSTISNLLVTSQLTEKIAIDLNKPAQRRVRKVTIERAGKNVIRSRGVVYNTKCVSVAVNGQNNTTPIFMTGLKSPFGQNLGGRNVSVSLNILTNDPDVVVDILSMFRSNTVFEALNNMMTTARGILKTKKPISPTQSQFVSDIASGNGQIFDNELIVNLRMARSYIRASQFIDGFVKQLIDSTGGGKITDINYDQEEPLIIYHPLLASLGFTSFVPLTANVETVQGKPGYMSIVLNCQWVDTRFKMKEALRYKQKLNEGQAEKATAWFMTSDENPFEEIANVTDNEALNAMKKGGMSNIRNNYYNKRFKPNKNEKTGVKRIRRARQIIAEKGVELTSTAPLSVYALYRFARSIESIREVATDQSIDVNTEEFRDIIHTFTTLNNDVGISYNPETSLSAMSQFGLFGAGAAAGLGLRSIGGSLLKKFPAASFFIEGGIFAHTVGTTYSNKAKRETGEILANLRAEGENPFAAIFPENATKEFAADILARKIRENITSPDRKALMVHVNLPFLMSYYFNDFIIEILKSYDNLNPNDTKSTNNLTRNLDKWGNKASDVFGTRIFLANDTDSFLGFSAQDMKSPSSPLAIYRHKKMNDICFIVSTIQDTSISSFSELDPDKEAEKLKKNLELYLDPQSHTKSFEEAIGEGISNPTNVNNAETLTSTYIKAIYTKMGLSAYQSILPIMGRSVENIVYYANMLATSKSPFIRAACFGQITKNFLHEFANFLPMLTMYGSDINRINPTGFARPGQNQDYDELRKVCQRLYTEIGPTHTFRKQNIKRLIKRGKTVIAYGNHYRIDKQRDYRIGSAIFEALRTFIIITLKDYHSLQQNAATNAFALGNDPSELEDENIYWRVYVAPYIADPLEVRTSLGIASKNLGDNIIFDAAIFAVSLVVAIVLVKLTIVSAPVWGTALAIATVITILYYLIGAIPTIVDSIVGFIRTLSVLNENQKTEIEKAQTFFQRFPIALIGSSILFKMAESITEDMLVYLDNEIYPPEVNDGGSALSFIEDPDTHLSIPLRFEPKTGRVFYPGYWIWSEHSREQDRVVREMYEATMIAESNKYWGQDLNEGEIDSIINSTTQVLNKRLTGQRTLVDSLISNLVKIAIYRVLKKPTITGTVYQDYVSSAQSFSDNTRHYAYFYNEVDKFKNFLKDVADELRILFYNESRGVLNTNGTNVNPVRDSRRIIFRLTGAFNTEHGNAYHIARQLTQKEFDSTVVHEMSPIVDVYSILYRVTFNVSLRELDEIGKLLSSVAAIPKISLTDIHNALSSVINQFVVVSEAELVPPKTVGGLEVETKNEFKTKIRSILGNNQQGMIQRARNKSLSQLIQDDLPGDLDMNSAQISEIYSLTSEDGIVAKAESLGDFRTNRNAISRYEAENLTPRMLRQRQNLLRATAGAYGNAGIEVFKSRAYEVIRNNQWKSIGEKASRMNPTFKFYFLQENSREWMLMDDYYSYSAVEDIQTYESATSPVVTAVITLSNFTNNLANMMSDRIYRENPLFHDPQLSADVNSTMIKPGCKIKVYMGYGSLLYEDDCVFVGEIASMQGDQTMKLECTGFGSFLMENMGTESPEVVGVSIYDLEDEKNAYSVQELLLRRMFTRNFIEKFQRIDGRLGESGVLIGAGSIDSGTLEPQEYGVLSGAINLADTVYYESIIKLFQLASGAKSILGENDLIVELISKLVVTKDKSNTISENIKVWPSPVNDTEYAIYKRFEGKDDDIVNSLKKQVEQNLSLPRTFFNSTINKIEALEFSIGSLYANTIEALKGRKPSNVLFVGHNQSYWDAIQEMLLQLPNHACVVRPFDDRNTIVVTDHVRGYYRTTRKVFTSELKTNNVISQLESFKGNNEDTIGMVMDSIFEDSEDSLALFILFYIYVQKMLVTMGGKPSGSLDFNIPERNQIETVVAILNKLMNENRTNNPIVIPKTIPSVNTTDKDPTIIEKAIAFGKSLFGITEENKKPVAQGPSPIIDTENIEDFIKRVGVPITTTVAARKWALLALLPIDLVKDIYTSSDSTLQNFYKKLGIIFSKQMSLSSAISKEMLERRLNKIEISLYQVSIAIEQACSDILTWALTTAYTRSSSHRKLSENHYKTAGIDIVTNHINLMKGFNAAEVSILKDVDDLDEVVNEANETPSSKVDVQKVQIDTRIRQTNLYKTFIKNPAAGDVLDPQKAHTSMALNVLTNLIRDYYSGNIVLTGDSHIRAWDMLTIYDDNRDMFGSVHVKEVINSYNKHTGWTTTVTPMLPAYNDYAISDGPERTGFELILNSSKTIVAAGGIALLGIFAVRRSGSMITAFRSLAQRNSIIQKALKYGGNFLAKLNRTPVLGKIYDVAKSGFVKVGLFTESLRKFRHYLFNFESPRYKAIQSTIEGQTKKIVKLEEQVLKFKEGLPTELHSKIDELVQKYADDFAGHVKKRFDVDKTLTDISDKLYKSIKSVKGNSEQNARNYLAILKKIEQETNNEIAAIVAKNGTKLERDIKTTYEHIADELRTIEGIKGNPELEARLIENLKTIDGTIDTTNLKLIDLGIDFNANVGNAVRRSDDGASYLVSEGNLTDTERALRFLTEEIENRANLVEGMSTIATGEDILQRSIRETVQSTVSTRSQIFGNILGIGRYGTGSQIARSGALAVASQGAFGLGSKGIGGVAGAYFGYSLFESLVADNFREGFQGLLSDYYSQNAITVSGLFVKGEPYVANLDGMQKGNIATPDRNLLDIMRGRLTKSVDAIEEELIGNNVGNIALLNNDFREQLEDRRSTQIQRNDTQTIRPQGGLQ